MTYKKERFHVNMKVWGRYSQGSPLPEVASPSIALIYSSRTASHIIIHSSKTTSHVYILAQQHREYIFKPNRIARIYSSRTTSYVRIYTHPGSGDPWEWRPVTKQTSEIFFGVVYMSCYITVHVILSPLHLVEKHTCLIFRGQQYKPILTAQSPSFKSLRTQHVLKVIS